RRIAGARGGARREGLRGARPRRQAAEHGHRAARGDERSPALVTSGSIDTNVGHLLRELAPQVLGAVARRHDFADAEDAVQEALIAAAARWPAEGIPRNPRGWLYHVAMRRITDQLRSELARRRREDAVASEVWAEWAFVPPPDGEGGIDRDD